MGEGCVRPTDGRSCTRPLPRQPPPRRRGSGAFASALAECASRPDGAACHERRRTSNPTKTSPPPGAPRRRAARGPAPGAARARPQPGRNRQPARLRRRTRRRRKPHRHAAHHQLRPGVLRTPADAGDRVRPAGAHHVHQPAQLHLRQRRGRHRQHPVAALRRLPELHPAAGDAGGVQGRGVGQLRPDGGGQRDDLLDRRRAAGRPARHRGDAHRGPALHHDRAHPGRAADPGGAGRPVRQLRPALSR